MTEKEREGESQLASSNWNNISNQPDLNQNLGSSKSQEINLLNNDYFSLGQQEQSNQFSKFIK